MSEYFAHLNLNINPVTIDHVHLKNQYQTKIMQDQLNPELIDLLKNYGVKITYAESFYSPPPYIQRIHTDEFGGDFVKINFIYGGHGSQMHWYKVKENVNSNIVKKTSTSVNYIQWNPDMVDLVESDSIAHPSLVQVGCPHNITNKDEYRLCITVVLNDLVSSDRLTMSQARIKLSEFLI